MAAERIPQWKIDHPTWRFDHVAAGKKAMATSQRLYSRPDESFSQMIGRTGGTQPRGGGKPFDHDRAVYWGSVGGKVATEDEEEPSRRLTFVGHLGSYRTRLAIE